MLILQGKSVYGGIRIGELYFYNNKNENIDRKEIEDMNKEIERFEKARSIAMSQLEELYESAVVQVGEEHTMIMKIHLMMLEDLDYIDSVINIIKSERVNAEYAIHITGNNFSAIFSEMDDEYMQGRAADVLDISNRLIRALTTQKEEKIILTEPVIIAAIDLAPSETIQLDKSKVLSIVTMKGTISSHTAILARNMGIPAIVSVEGDLEQYHNKLTIVDGYTGTIYIEPDEVTLISMKEKLKKEEEQKALLLLLKGKENITKNGQRVNLYSNIGSKDEINAVIENDAGGIGLFRSEFLYLEKDTYPTEDELFKAYKQVAERMEGKKVIIRTLDIGADKSADYFNIPKEENPALGYRAIRICLTRKDIFKTQLRAIYRATAYGNISIMFPMIISLDEIREAKEIVEEVKRELQENDISFDDKVEIGIMIETPAAAIISDLLAKEVDFFSIGTNDLTQYTIAVDRQNENLNKFYNPHHIALLRLISLTAKNAHQNGIWVGICGELASDLSLTETFLRMGIDELSVSSSMILPIRKKVRELDLEQTPIDETKEVGEMLWN